MSAQIHLRLLRKCRVLTVPGDSEGPCFRDEAGVRGLGQRLHKGGPFCRHLDITEEQAEKGPESQASLGDSVLKVVRAPDLTSREIIYKTEGGTPRLSVWKSSNIICKAMEINIQKCHAFNY